MPKAIGNPIKKDKAFFENEDNMKNLLRILNAKAEQIKLGGGKDAIEKHHKRGKLTARERIQKLIDPGSEFLEIGLFAAYGMYEEYGGAPSAGVVVGIGKIHGRDVVIVANDATVKAGAWFPITCKKNLRAQEIAMENRIPIVYLVDSAGVFLPLQSEIFPDKEHFGRIFRNNAIMSSMGIPQIAAIMGPCVAGGAYLPIMSDEALIVEGTGSVFLAGPHLVKAAIGEEIDIETLGGATVHSEISGVTDYKCKNDEEAIETIRSIISKLGETPKANFNRIEPRPPKYDPYEIYGIIPKDITRPYDMYEVLARIVDDSEIDEYKAGYGKTLICAYARIDGWAVGIVANQRSIVKTKLGEMQVGGVIYSDSADKAARFIMNCNQKRIPLVFFQDVTGFMVGKRAEWGGIIKDGAKMVNAVANSTVPKFTFIIGNSFGAGNYAMCGKAYDPRFIFAWPTAQIAVMGGKQASETLLSIKLSQMEKEGKIITKEEQEKLLKEIQERYEREMEPLFAAARLWVDGIIDPVETRKIISRGIEIANNNPYIPKFNVGVIQT
ncbi:Acetyl-CoA carboxylase, carboxyltransferase component [Candidatus Kryptonium thompsonii]|uniref:Acetyl-CoA carboxylase, carboxyltransferase component n=1 Tax=Candidatus Kryptonium thompsonii TaxID=1633631 RepID=A0A0P1LXH7_9BACT|nr:acyl-CoA carboxylase subunit beta [Candidatus Kryptonium thompsoni]CUS78301.1 Acetyl-CoA carboxylase, carboxyltransferase component [Candidatus Kryptonium thompsoni]CUS78491.1 Acetyl-CoA carboxylase, carboxyltransferase component [Candidatus Kryptonium thompsoni]CUS80190.1 Acetyl-CoA carboxylase, carboxyltransferase component [Candidatus Kryptonium thompsoni]CUS85621.1 Acetyl-CoA carboxylase, carboxyltransferase component [Candidatus Kryptonium thompsoni]CUS86812.1 Acetyl-CoA carboxylase, c